MPRERIKSAAKNMSGVLDVNGDGVIDHRDAVAAAQIAGSAIVGIGATVAAGAVAGSAIVATGATAIAAKVTFMAGAAAGAFIAGTLGASTVVTACVFDFGSLVIIGSSSVTSISAPLVAAASTAGGWVAQAATGKVAGMAIIQKVALTQAVTAGEVVVIAGVPIGVTAALAAGIIAIVIVAGYAYYLLTKDAIGDTGRQGDFLLSPT